MMKIQILDHKPGLSRYLQHLLRAWGLSHVTLAEQSQLDLHAQTWIIPATANIDVKVAQDFVTRGGTLVLLHPNAAMAKLAGLEMVSELTAPMLLRFATFLPHGFAGESPPIVGPMSRYQLMNPAKCAAYLSTPEQYDDEIPALTITPLGRGRIIAFAFDLARCIMLLRQGDPALADFIPPADRCNRPTHFSARTGRHDSGWIPYADLLAQMLMQLLIEHASGPLPLLDHLPHAAPAILLYSGDEDVAPVEHTNDELQYLQAHQVRMDLNIIPNHTVATHADVQRFAEHHDINPHPDLRPLDGRPVAEKLQSLRDQIHAFNATYQCKATSVRTHCVAWAGYMEHVDVLQECSIQMETSYLSGCYKLRRDMAPYNPFGAAMPVRFTHPDGTFTDVIQQHTHFIDDLYFAPFDGDSKATTYSFRLDLSTFTTILTRVYHDMVHRFHTPLGVCIHPGNWPLYSKAHGQLFVELAQQNAIAMWSFSQWNLFCRNRELCVIEQIEFKNNQMTFALSMPAETADLRVRIPMHWKNLTLSSVNCDGKSLAYSTHHRHNQPHAFLAFPKSGHHNIAATYS